MFFKTLYNVRIALYEYYTLVNPKIFLALCKPTNYIMRTIVLVNSYKIDILESGIGHFWEIKNHK